jgi:hypothetical protein
VVLSLVCGAAILLAALRWLRPVTVLDIFLGIYAAIMLAWAWPPDRFAFIVYPLILLAVWRVWRAASQRFPARAAILRTGGFAIFAAVVLQSVWNLGDAARTAIRIGVQPVMGPQDAWSETSAQLDWIRDQTPADSIILTNLDPVFYLYTGRKAVRGFMADPYRLFYIQEPGSQPLGTLADFRATIRNEGINYIVRAPNQVFAEASYLDRMILELARTEPHAISLVEQGKDAHFQIYRVEQPI